METSGIVYWCYIGIMEKKMETTSILGLCPFWMYSTAKEHVVVFPNSGLRVWGTHFFPCHPA